MLVWGMSRPDTAPMPMFDIPMCGCQSRTCWARGAKVSPWRKLDWVVDGCTHAMRTVGQIKRAFDMMCQRALVAHDQGRECWPTSRWCKKRIADSWIEMEAFRLLVLRTAWRIDQFNDYVKVRKDIAAIKAMMPKVYHDVVSRCIQVHGALGVSNELPLIRHVVELLRDGHRRWSDRSAQGHDCAPSAQRLRPLRRPYSPITPCRIGAPRPWICSAMKSNAKSRPGREPASAQQQTRSALSRSINAASQRDPAAAH